MSPFPAPLRLIRAGMVLLLTASAARAQGGFADDLETREDREELLLQSVRAAVGSRDLDEPSVLRGHDPRHGPEVDRRAARIIRGRRVTLSFEDAPVSDVLDTLGAISGLTFMTSSRARRELAVGEVGARGRRERRQPASVARREGERPRRQPDRQLEPRRQEPEETQRDEAQEAREKPQTLRGKSATEPEALAEPRAGEEEPHRRTREPKEARRERSGRKASAGEKASREGERTVTIAATNLTLESFLNALAFRLGDHRFTLREGIVFLVHEEEVKPRRVLRIYDVSDIVRPPPDFPAPRLGLGGMEFEEGF